MKTLILFLCLLPFAATGQTPLGNGLYTVALPNGASPMETRLKKAFFVDDSASVWVGFNYLPTTVSLGLAKYSGGTWTVFNSSNSGLPVNNITDLTPVGNSTLLVGTTKGLAILDRQNNTWQVIDKQSHPSLPSNHIHTVAASGNKIWMGTEAGLALLENNVLTVYDSSAWNHGSNRVQDLLLLGNRVYAATGSGLAVLNGGTWSTYTTGTQEEIYELTADNAGVIWLYATSGLWYFESGVIHPVTDKITCFGRLEKEHLVNGSGLATDASGSAVFLSGINTNISGSFLYRINGNALQRFRYPVSMAGTGHYCYLRPDNAGNIWMLNNNADAMYFVNLAQYREDVGPGITTGKNFHKLDINKMSAGILNHGDMFWNLSEHSLEVPKGSCKNISHASSLWIAGTDPINNLHLAAQNYRQQGDDYYPGPLDTITTLGDSSWQNPYNRIWKINRRDVELFKIAYANGSVGNGSYQIPVDIREWPAHGTGNYSRSLAPFVDVNADGLYNPLQGDYPRIKGDQMLFWIFNDNSAMHSESAGNALGMEIHASAYAYNCNNTADGTADEVLNFTTFYEYKIINRSSFTYKDVYFGNWMDPEIGNNTDDFVGSNPQENFVFSYNADNSDEGWQGYGENPPMINVLWLSDTLRSFIAYENNYSVMGNPGTPDHYYGYLTGRWKDGSHMTHGGNGYNTNVPTNFMFDGVPYDTAQWNEYDVTHAATDRRMVSSVSTDEMRAGAVKEIAYAIVYSHYPSAPNGIATSWAKNLADIAKVKSWYRQQNFPVCDGAGASIFEQEADPHALRVYPNPGNNSFDVDLSQLNGGQVELVVTDMSGKSLYQATAGSGESYHRIPSAGWAGGIYFVQVTGNGSRYAAKWVKQPGR